MFDGGEVSSEVEDGGSNPDVAAANVGSS